MSTSIVEIRFGGLQRVVDTPWRWRGGRRGTLARPACDWPETTLPRLASLPRVAERSGGDPCTSKYRRTRANHGGAHPPSCHEVHVEWEGDGMGLGDQGAQVGSSWSCCRRSCFALLCSACFIVVIESNWGLMHRAMGTDEISRPSRGCLQTMEGGGPGLYDPKRRDNRAMRGNTGSNIHGSRLRLGGRGTQTGSL